MRVGHAHGEAMANVQAITRKVARLKSKFNINRLWRRHVEQQNKEVLFVRTQSGRYRPADSTQIIEAARAVVDRNAVKGMAFADMATSQRFFIDKLSGLQREVFAVAFLDTRNRLIAHEEMFMGTIDGAEVHAREVVRRGLALGAGAVIVAHNHPSGHLEPSAADRAVTSRLKQALALVDIRLLDHIVVGGLQAVSLAARGWV